MIVKMTILRLLGSSDDKEKIGVARPFARRAAPTGVPLRSRPSRVSGQRPETSSVQRTKIEETVKKSSQNRDNLLSSDEPTMKAKDTSVQLSRRLETRNTLTD